MEQPQTDTKMDVDSNTDTVASNTDTSASNTNTAASSTDNAAPTAAANASDATTVADNDMACIPTPLPLPVILFLSLAHDTLFDVHYASLISLISSKARIERVTSRSGLVHFFENNAPPQAIFITDQGIADLAGYMDTPKLVKNFVRSGGRAVIGGSFSSRVGIFNMRRLFRFLGLKWERGNVFQSTVYLNGEANRLRTERLEKSFDIGAVFLKRVLTEDSIYLRWYHVISYSSALSPEGLDTRQTPIAFEQMGDGWVGYVGAMNAEEGCNEVYMAMLGL